MPRLRQRRFMISAQDLTIRAGGETLLDRVNLKVDAGEIVTIVGPNGSGKTTLIRSLIGALPPSDGFVTLKPGVRIGYVPQKLSIDPTMPMSVQRFLSLPKRQSPEAVCDVLKRVDAIQTINAQIANLSGGQLQRVLLARALLHDPQILILDEPTQGLDQLGIADFYALIASVRDELGCAVLMVSHDLHVVMSASDRVICLNGHICCEGAPEMVSAAPEYRALFGLGTQGALAIYRHEHDHHHDGCDHDHTHVHGDETSNA